MLTFTFITTVIINAILLLALLGVIYKRNTSDNEDIKLEKYLDILILGLFIGIVAAIALSAVIIV